MSDRSADGAFLQPRKAKLFLRALRRRCPICAHRPIFAGWFELRPTCGRCGLRFERREGEFVGAVGVNTIVTFGALLIFVVAAAITTAPDMPVVPLIIGAAALTIIVPIVMYPFSKTLWLATDLVMLPLEDGEAPGATPGGEVEPAEGP